MKPALSLFDCYDDLIATVDVDVTDIAAIIDVAAERQVGLLA